VPWFAGTFLPWGSADIFTRWRTAPPGSVLIFDTASALWLLSDEWKRRHPETALDTTEQRMKACESLIATVPSERVHTAMLHNKWVADPFIQVFIRREQ
jgi:hypothetical protein